MPATVLVLRALGLGDLLTALPALRGLRGAFPSHRLALVMPRALEPLAQLARVADEVVEPKQVPAPRAVPHSLPERLRGADVAVNLHGRGPESTALLRGTGPRRLIAFGEGGVEWRAGEHEVERWCRLLAESGIPADPSWLELPAPPVEPPAAARGATVIHPGADAPARRWPAERWAEVARAEESAGRRVVLTGSPAERDLALDVARRAGLPPDSVLAGRTDLVELAATIAAAARVACADTGVGHLATALGTSSVVLFGPVPPHEWGPPPARRAHSALWKGRRGDPHARRPDPGLLAIEPREVVGALRAR